MYLLLIYTFIICLFLFIYLFVYALLTQGTKLLADLYNGFMGPLLVNSTEITVAQRERSMQM